MWGDVLWGNMLIIRREWMIDGELTVFNNAVCCLSKSFIVHCKIYFSVYAAIW